ncbi:hypothetical protein KY289_000872 [Solanum tuberosum]|nr:hypothetical protein KY289_000872 [Solanum tuberosum]
MEHYRLNFEYRFGKWEPPPNNLLKCNTDGASKGNPGPNSAAFCIKDHDRNLIVAKGFKLPDMTNKVAEAIDIRESLIYCSEHGIKHVILETNSLTMVHILEGEWDVPWSVAIEVNAIRRLRGVVPGRNSNSILDNRCMNWINLEESDLKLPACLLDSELEGRPLGEVLGLCLHSWD